LSLHVAAEVHDAVMEFAVQLGTVPPVMFVTPQQSWPAGHSPVITPPSGPFEPTQSSGVPPASAPQAPPSAFVPSHAAV
jgi:hypothetical protein